MAEVYFIAAIIVGFAFLFGREAVRRSRSLRTADRLGLTEGAGLSELPTCFQHTVLFVIGDGGHESQVLCGPIAVGDRSIDATVFDFALQRDVRGEWGYLDTRPPFRLHSPVTVVALMMPPELDDQLGDALGHMLIKRRGAAERIAEAGLERYKSAVDIARDVSAIERAMAVSPPSGLPEEPTPIDALDRDYLIWMANPAQAEKLLGEDVAAYLRSPQATGREIVVELLGGLMLVYCATHGDLADRDIDSLVEFATELCRRMLETCATDARHNTD